MLEFGHRKCRRGKAVLSKRGCDLCVVLQAFLEIIINLQFQLVETLWMSFWRKVHTDNLER